MLRLDVMVCYRKYSIYLCPAAGMNETSTLWVLRSCDVGSDHKRSRFNQDFVPKAMIPVWGAYMRSSHTLHAIILR